MNITIIWASRWVGLATVKRALERWHIVTTLARSELSLPPSENIKTIQGNALKKENLQKSLEWCDALIVTLGNKNFGGTNLFSEFAGLLTEVSPKIPCIILTGFWSGKSGKYNTPIMKVFFALLLRKIYEDKTTMEEIIAKSQLLWTIVRPWLLTNGRFTGAYRVETSLFSGVNIWAISRTDVADFLIKEAENQKYTHQYPALSLK